MTQGHYKSAAVLAFVLCAPALFSCCAPVFAATYSNLAGSATGFQYRHEPRAYVVEQTHDFYRRSVTTGDTVRLLHIPPMARVLSVQASIVSASSAIAGDDQSITVGDDADGDGWLTGVDPTGSASYDSTPSLSFAFAPQTGTITGFLDGEAIVTNVSLALEYDGANVTNAILSKQTGTLSDHGNAFSVVTNGTVTVTVSPAYAMGKYYAAADTIDIRVAGRITNGQLRVRAAAIDLSR